MAPLQAGALVLAATVLTLAAALLAQRPLGSSGSSPFSLIDSGGVLRRHLSNGALHQQGPQQHSSTINSGGSSACGNAKEGAPLGTLTQPDIDELEPPRSCMRVRDACADQQHLVLMDPAYRPDAQRPKRLPVFNPVAKYNFPWKSEFNPDVMVSLVSEGGVCVLAVEAGRHGARKR